MQIFVRSTYDSATDTTRLKHTEDIRKTACEDLTRTCRLHTQQQQQPDARKVSAQVRSNVVVGDAS